MAYSESEIRCALAFLTALPSRRRTVNKNHTAYYWKHKAENWGGSYVSEEAFCYVAEHLGIESLQSGSGTYLAITEADPEPLTNDHIRAWIRDGWFAYYAEGHPPPSTSALYHDELYVRDPVESLVWQLLDPTENTPPELLAYLADSRWAPVRYMVAQHPNTPADRADVLKQHTHGKEVPQVRVHQQRGGARAE